MHSSDTPAARLGKNARGLQVDGLASVNSPRVRPVDGHPVEGAVSMPISSIRSRRPPQPDPQIGRTPPFSGGCGPDWAILSGKAIGKQGPPRTAVSSSKSGHNAQNGASSKFRAGTPRSLPVRNSLGRRFVVSAVRSTLGSMKRPT